MMKKGRKPAGLDREELLQAILDNGKLFYDRQWLWGSAGNLSVRLPGRDNEMAITPSGLNKGRLRADQLIILRGAEAPPARPDGLVPSSDSAIHQAVYRALPGANAVFHVHPIYSTLVAFMHGHPRQARTVDVGWFEMMRGAGVRDEEHAGVTILPNWQDPARLAQDLTHYIERTASPLPAVLLFNHGLTAWGITPDQARNHLEIFEYVCRYLYLKRLVPSS